MARFADPRGGRGAPFQALRVVQGCVVCGAWDDGGRLDVGCPRSQGVGMMDGQAGEGRRPTKHHTPNTKLPVSHPPLALNPSDGMPFGGARQDGARPFHEGPPMIIPPSAVASTARRAGLAATIVCLCCAAPLAAVQFDDEEDVDWGDLPQAMKINDVRVGLALLPANANITTIRNGATSYQRDSVFETGGRTALMWMMPLGDLDEDGGFVGGIEVSRNHYRMAGSLYQPDIDDKIWAVSPHIGLGWMISNHTHLETTLYGGYGTASFTPGKYGTYWEYGARAGLFYTFNRGLQVGLHISYIESHSAQVYTENSISYDVDVQTRGGYGGLMVGWRL